MNNSEEKIYRILDANLNRLREGIRVVEEFFRFFCEEKIISLRLKELRHHVRDIENSLDHRLLLKTRDSENDPFASGVTAKEGERASLEELLFANLRRGQESCRVLEEYCKLIEGAANSIDYAKKIRFSLYTLEKESHKYV